MKRYVKYVSLGVFLLLSLRCNQSDNTIIDIDQKIQNAMEENQIPSVVACVIKGDEIVWEGTYGYADKSNNELANRNTAYTIMSIGKLMLSTAVFQLWENGAIDLDADISQYLPYPIRNPHFPDKKITPNMLLNHTSSLAWPEDSDRLPNFQHFYSFEEPPLISEWLPQYILTEGINYRSTVWKDFMPGDKFLYSNIGTSLLALVLEEITGQDYRDYCKANIMDPLEMYNSAFRFKNLDEASLVTPYNDRGDPISYYTCRHYPAGFLTTDIEDFSHFIIAMLNKGQYRGNRILQESTFDKMLELQDPTSGTANLWVHCLGDCVGHLGGGTGFSTWAEWHLMNDRALFIFSNKVNSAIAPSGRIYELVKYQAFKY